MPRVDLTNKHVLISRTDSIGDVMLTLPICSWLKKSFPGVKITFLGKSYTKSIIEAFEDIDYFLNWDEVSSMEPNEQLECLKTISFDAIIHVFPNKEIARLAKTAKIPVRVGTSHRSYHLFTCNHRINFTRKKSPLHEAQLNHMLLRPFGLENPPSLQDIETLTSKFNRPSVELPSIFSGLEVHTILHPKSQGSAKEWPLEKYFELAVELANKGQKVVFTGTENEGVLFREQLPIHENIIDTTGQLTLEQLMVLISKANNLVACSTGPLHIAGYFGINAIGLFSPKRPIHPGRWRPLGKNVEVIVFDESCQSCAKGEDCNCVKQITIKGVLDKIR